MSKEKTVKTLVDDAISDNKESEVKRLQANFKQISVAIPSFTAPSGFKNREFKYNYQTFSASPCPLRTCCASVIACVWSVREGG